MGREPTPFNLPLELEWGEKLYESKFIEEEPLERFVRPAQAENYQLLKPDHIVGYFKEYVYNPFDAFNQEEMYALLCDTQNTVRYETMVYRGTVDTINIRVGELFRNALIYNMPTIAIAHNHPSGSSHPSQADLNTTEAIVAAGKLLGVHVLDHVIIGRETCTSFMRSQLPGFK